MTQGRTPAAASSAFERRERGLALADALLESGRQLGPLSDAAHARVKRRLLASNRRRSFRRPGWLRPVVVVSVCLICGAAFGVALDRVVLKRGAGIGTSSEAVSDPRRSQTRLRRKSLKPANPERIEEVKLDSSGSEPSGPQPPAPQLSALDEASRPTVGAEHATLAEASSPARVGKHPKTLALRGEPLDTSPRPPMPAWRDPAPVAPSIAPADWVPPVAPIEPTLAPGPQSPVVPKTATEPMTRVDPVKSPAADGLSEERLLAAVIRALRTERDPRSALASLDEYRARYSSGRLLVEAEVLRVDALTALNQPAAALRVLDGLDFARMPGGLARQLQRGELRAAAGRQREAEADFANVLLRARNQDLDTIERALWGRAQSRASLGDVAGARIDANDYRRRFPTGRFATAASRMGDPVDP
jgi:hypothetical protein